MQETVGQMITAGIKAVKLIIKHQRKPRKGVPKFGIGCAECPTKSVQRDSRLDMTVPCDVSQIIKDEVILIHLPENDKRQYCQNYTNNKFLSAGTDIYLIKHNDLLSLFIPHVKLAFSCFVDYEFKCCPNRGKKKNNHSGISRLLVSSAINIQRYDLYLCQAIFFC